MSPFEAGMLICFGASWPLDIYKSLKSRSTAGKSVMFMFVLCVGYIFGIINKIVYNHDIVLVLYIRLVRQPRWLSLKSCGFSG